MDCVRVQDTELNDPMWVSNEKNFLNLWGTDGVFAGAICTALSQGQLPFLGGGAVAAASTSEVHWCFACYVPLAEAVWEPALSSDCGSGEWRFCPCG